MEGAVTSFKAKDYKTAVKDLADGLEGMSLALKDQACGLNKIADLIGKLSPKLAAAVVKVEDSKAVQIIVESADVYDDIFQLVEAIDSGDWDTVGEELGNLLRVREFEYLGLWVMFRGFYLCSIVVMFHYYWCNRKP